VVLVDTSVWVDYFDQNVLWQSSVLDKLLLDDQVLMCDIIYTEVLQGFRKDKDFYLVQSILDNLPFVAMVGKELAFTTAKNYRQLRKNSLDIHNKHYMLIATYCVKNKIFLLHNNNDFNIIKKQLDLKTLKP
jgi:predicted nucleic acid-binding protein